MNSTEVNHDFTLDGARRGGKSTLCAVGLALVLGLLSLGLAGRAEGAPAIECTSGSAPYRINAGGPELQTPNGVFCMDTKNAPSEYNNTEVAGNRVLVLKPEDPAIDMSDPSIPAGTPEALFRTERWDPEFSPNPVEGEPPVANEEMSWEFPVAPGAYEVRLYFAEIWNNATTDQISPDIACCQDVGKREFDVLIEGDLKLDDYDVFQEVGGFKGVVKTFAIDSQDGAVNIDFQRVTQNPAIKAIEVLPSAAAVNTAPTIKNLKPSGKIRDRTPRIGATVSDAESELSAQNMKLFVDNRARAFDYDPDTDRLSAVSKRLSYGVHTVKVVATDASGKEATDVSRFRVARRR